MPAKNGLHKECIVIVVFQKIIKNDKNVWHSYKRK